MQTFELAFLGNTKVIFEGEATSLSVPTEAGRMQILASHQPMIVSVSLGESFIQSPDKELHITHGTGILSIESSRVVVLVFEAHFADKLTQENILHAKEKAEEGMRNASKPGRAVKAQRSFARAVLDEKVLRKKHK
jgi:F-type H+-transporting ATPase subunit epsilon